MYAMPRHCRVAANEAIESQACTPACGASHLTCACCPHGSTAVAWHIFKQLVLESRAGSSTQPVKVAGAAPGSSQEPVAGSGGDGSTVQLQALQEQVGKLRMQVNNNLAENPTPNNRLHQCQHINNNTCNVAYAG